MPETDWTLDEIGSRIDGFLGPLIDAAGFDLGYEISEGHRAGALIQPDITVAFRGRDTELLLAYKAELLLALDNILHLALRDNDRVRTESEGTAPHRHTVIYPADAGDSSRQTR